MLVRYRGLIAIGVILASLYGGVFYFHLEKTRQMAIEGATERIRHMLLFNRALRAYLEEVQKPVIYRLQREGKLYPEFFAPEVLSSSFIARNVFARYSIELAAAGHPEYSYRLAAKNPLNRINAASPKELDILRRVNEEGLKDYTEVYERDAKTYLLHTIPIEPNQDSCLYCHGDYRDAPVEIVNRYGIESGFNEKLGHARAIISIEAPLDEEIAGVRRTFIAIPATIAMAFALVFILAWLHYRSIWKREREIERKNAALEQKVNESELLLKEIHHRVKNNLMVVEGLLRLHSGGSTDERTRDALAETESRVRAMSLVHEQLYKAHDLKRLDFQAYLRALATAIVRHYWVTPTRVGLMVDVPAVPADVDTVIPCGLIVNELMTNSLKHAFPGGREGTITVSLSAPQRGQWALAVRDDGIGMPEWIEPEDAKTMGMKIIRTLVEQLGGSLDIIRNTNASASGGTEVRVTFNPQNSR